MLVRILDLDDGVAQQQRLRQRATLCLPLRVWGPQLRMACSWRAFHNFERELVRQSGDALDRHSRITFVGSGDFHHLSLALLRRQPRPCNVLVLDNHPDWMRRVPFLHCGTWLYHAAHLPQVYRIFHVGGDVDFDNHYRWLAPWRLLRSGKISVLPAIRSFQGKAWQQIPHQKVRETQDIPARREDIEELLAPWRFDLGRFPLYISFDRDVLRGDQAIVNWDSGRLVASEVLAILKAFLAASGGLAGMDVVGDWSAVQVQGLLRTFLHWTEHPTMDVDPHRARELNEQLNLMILDLVALAARGRGRTTRAA